MGSPMWNEFNNLLTSYVNIFTLCSLGCCVKKRVFTDLTFVLGFCEINALKISELLLGFLSS